MLNDPFESKLNKAIWDQLQSQRRLVPDKEFSIPYKTIGKKLNCDIRHIKRFRAELVRTECLKMVSRQGRGRFLFLKEPEFAEELKESPFEPFFKKPENPDSIQSLPKGLVRDFVKAWKNAIDKNSLESFTEYVDEYEEKDLDHDDKEFIRYLYKDLKGRVKKRGIDWLD